MRNNKSKDRKSGKFTFKWLGPYVVSDIAMDGIRSDISDGINEHHDFPEDEIDQKGADCIEDSINNTTQKNQPLDEKSVENSQNSQIHDETPAIAINGWDKLPDEIVEKILIRAIKSSDHVCETYSNIINSCSRFQIIEKRGKCCFLVFISN